MASLNSFDLEWLITGLGPDYEPSGFEKVSDCRALQLNESISRINIQNLLRLACSTPC